MELSISEFTLLLLFSIGCPWDSLELTLEKEEDLEDVHDEETEKDLVDDCE